ncbi:hypothetical protein E3N88_11535 [Mikania micrantha]|uniref:FAR1 domain-containing protein n=1 Tax=Mikania micrantha TaxID=192012 RepID=A0A5N6PFQ4_9ASTR|nr:hypothetical protein E3N88_11535 [Mikania micrantha]
MVKRIKVFAGVDELVDWAIARGRENGYVLVRRRSKTNATGVVIKVWLKCDRGGVYHGEPKARRTGSKKTGCEFELIGRYERSCGGWKLRVVNNEHNHLAAEQLGGHPYAMRLNENETRLVEQLSNQNMLPRDILAAVKDQNPENVSNLRNIYNARRNVRDLSGRVDRLEGMMRWMTESMAASAGMDIPVFPGPGHHQDPQDPGGHA